MARASSPETERRPRLPALRSSQASPSDPRIFWFTHERDGIVEDVTRRIVAETSSEPARVEHALLDLAFTELRRLARQRDGEASAHLGRFRSLSRRVGHLSPEEQARELHTQVKRLALDVAGNFDPRVYRFARGVLPRLLTGVMKPSALPSALLDRDGGPLSRILTVQGPVAQLRRLSGIGTLVYVPTHSSNLDSIALGQSLEMCGLPPVVYGAGKNLFANPLLSFFMHNLGAYRVDRRIQAGLYKDVLKAYASVMVERGCASRRGKTASGSRARPSRWRTP